MRPRIAMTPGPAWGRLLLEAGLKIRRELHPSPHIQEIKRLKDLVIYGPPGTGKTTRLMQILNTYLEEQPGRALFCAFTKAAISEARSRVSETVLARADIRTLHSVCFQSMQVSKAQTVSEERLARFGEIFGADMDEEGDGNKYMEVIAYAHAQQISIDRAYFEHSDRPGTVEHFRSFYKSYIGWKKEFGYIDFDDMLELASSKLNKLGPYGLVIIDEGQDFTPLQWAVIERFKVLLPKAQFVIALDDDQAIFTWAGAHPRGALEFGAKYKAETVVLDQSWRIPLEVHSLADKIVHRISDRVDKVYKPRYLADGQMARGTVSFFPDVTYMRDFRGPADHLILFADRFVRRDIESSLLEARILFTAINGRPAPMDNKAGQAMRLAHQGNTWAEEELGRIYEGLSPQGKTLWDSSGPKPVIQKLLDRNLSFLRPIHWSQRDYFLNIDWAGTCNVRISTFHSAKGMEADHVHLATAQSPSAVRQAVINPDYQHRVFYVAATRARTLLSVYGGESEYDIPTP